MAVIYSWTNQSGNRTIAITDDITVTKNEEYIGKSNYNIECSGNLTCIAQPSQGGATYEYIVTNGTIYLNHNFNTNYNLRHALYYEERNSRPSLSILNPVTTPSNTNDLTSFGYHYLPNYNMGEWAGRFWDFNDATTKTGTFMLATNIPIFTTYQDALDYCNAQSSSAVQLALKKAINFEDEVVEQEGQEFSITNLWTHGTWTPYGHSEGGQINYRNVRGKMLTGGKVSFYKIDGIDDGKLKYGVDISANFEGLEYSIDGVTWIATDTFPFNFFYRERINELGEFDYALTFSNFFFPTWDNHDDSTDYIQGEKDISDAPNYPQISGNQPPSNPTGEPDEYTEWGQVYTRAFFSQQYICSETALQQISNALFDTTQGGITGLFDDIKKGLEMYGEGGGVINAVQGCMYFPVNLNSVFTNTSSQNYIYFGGYKFDLDNATVNKIIYPNGHLDFGYFDLKGSFGSSHIRNYAPYTRLYVYLPYIGWQELDTERYINKRVHVKYFFDTRTGGCLATLSVGGTAERSLIIDYFSGQCGVSMPITLTDMSAYANAQIQTLLTFGNGQAQNVSNIASMASGLAKEGVETGALATASLGLGAVGVGIGATKTLYGLTQNNINNFNKTKGASTSMLNQYLPQEVCFMFEIQDADETANEMSLQGYPTNASGTLNSFSGYLEVDTVNLICANATANEKNEIIKTLQSGVYI